LPCPDRLLDIRELPLLDAKCSELALPAALPEFVEHQRLHLENAMEVLAIDWGMKVGCAAD
jgi:hypothetical protein